MIRVSSVLANYDGEFRQGHTLWHWCPACSVMHPIPHTWQFVTEDRESPSFTPSFMQWPSDPLKSCHYFITNGEIVWAGGSWHGRTGREPMVVLTDDMLSTV